MYCSYSGYKLNSQCPKAYWHRYIDKTTTPNADNCVNSLYGSTVGTLFEIFYRDKLWRRKDYQDFLISQAEPTLDLVIKNQRGSIVNWADEKANYHTRGELMRDVEAAIPRGLQTIREQRFVGPMAEAEMKLDHDFGPHRVGGRADFVIKRVPPQGDLLILDGKGSKWREKYVEESQLKWYAFLYRAKFKVVPDGLGFVFWRFEGEEAVGWIKFTSGDLDNLQDEVLGTMNQLEKGMSKLESLTRMPQAHDELRQELFPAQVSFGCKLCSYLEVCEEGLAKHGPRKSEGGFRKSRVELPGSGVRELSLDDEEV